MQLFVASDEIYYQATFGVSYVTVLAHSVAPDFPTDKLLKTFHPHHPSMIAMAGTATQKLIARYQAIIRIAHKGKFECCRVKIRRQTSSDRISRHMLGK